jgi:hypothetical protein
MCELFSVLHAYGRQSALRIGAAVIATSEARMALFKHVGYLLRNEHEAFDHDYEPDQVSPHSGIYRCMGCGREVVTEEGRALPPQNHHQHTTEQGTVRWRMIVYAGHNPKSN